MQCRGYTSWSAGSGAGGAQCAVLPRRRQHEVGIAEQRARREADEVAVLAHGHADDVAVGAQVGGGEGESAGVLANRRHNHLPVRAERLRQGARRRRSATNRGRGQEHQDAEAEEEVAGRAVGRQTGMNPRNSL